MMTEFFLVLLIHFLVLTLIKGDDYSTLWEKYQVIHQDRLLSAFNTEVALDNADKFITKIADSEKVLYYACSKYSYDDNTDSHDGGVFVPFLVDESMDLICYLVIPDHAYLSEEDWKFIINNPAALKIDDSIYHMVYTNSYPDITSYNKSELTVHFRAEFFDSSLKPSSDHENDNAGHDHFKKLLSKLESYSSKVPDHFYWTAQKTQEFYATYDGPPGFHQDAEHAARWNELKGYLSYADIQEDPCHFSTLSDLTTFMPGKLVLPLKELTLNKDSTLATACLAFLTAAIATETSVNQLAISGPVELLNFRARSIQESATASSSLSAAPYTDKGLTGGGNVVQVTDTGCDQYNCYFYDPVHGPVPASNLNAPTSSDKYRKIIGYVYNGCGDTSDEPSGHGTHVSGTVIGNIAEANIETTGKYDGVAPDGKLFFVDLGKPGTGLCIPPAKDLYNPAYGAGARVASNSWGSYFNGGGYYATQDTDVYLYKRPGLNILFAAGNAGQQGDDTITMETSGKNCISIGSSESTYGGPNITYVAFYSSKGLTNDNRVKPDVVAPGDALVSALASGTKSRTCGTTTMSGTSMATPAAAGAALLFRQYFMTASTSFWMGSCDSSNSFCKPFTPSGVLIKALMISSAEQMSLYHGGGSADIKLGTPPDNMQGFGRVQMNNVLPLKGVYDKTSLYVDDLRSITPGKTISYTVTVSTGSVPLRATLVWYDPPAVGGSTNKALMHDLDLIVTSPSGNRVFPNNRNSADSVNSVERVLVEKPSRGKWKLRVRGKAMPYSTSQLYSLVQVLGKAMPYSADQLYSLVINCDGSVQE